MTNIMENEIAATLRKMSPQETRMFLVQIKREAIEQIAEEQLRRLERQNKLYYLKFDEQIGKVCRAGQNLPTVEEGEAKGGDVGEPLRTTSGNKPKAAKGGEEKEKQEMREG